MPRQRARMALAVIVVLLAVIVGGGLLFYLAEGRSRGMGLLDCIYWAFITATTIGYGDIYPETPAGRAAAFIVAVSGIAAFTALVGIAAEGLVEQAARRVLGAGSVKLSGHVVVLGYSPAARALIEEVKANMPRTKIVIVDPEAPLGLGGGVEVVRGEPFDRETLRRAAADKAAYIAVPMLDDSKTILAVLHARRLNPRARIVALAVDEDNADIIKGAGADHVVPLSIVPMLMASYFYEPEVPEIIIDMASTSRGVLDVVVAPAEGLEGVGFCEAAERLLREGRGIPVAVAGPRGVEPLPGCDRVIGMGEKLILVVRGAGGTQ